MSCVGSSKLDASSDEIGSLKWENADPKQVVDELSSAFSRGYLHLKSHHKTSIMLGACKVTQVSNKAATSVRQCQRFARIPSSSTDKISTQERLKHPELTFKLDRKEIHT